MANATVEKTEEELRKEIEELHRQQWEVLTLVLDSPYSRPLSTFIMDLPCFPSYKYMFSLCKLFLMLICSLSIVVVL